jgi:hypothetical protein
MLKQHYTGVLENVVGIMDCTEWYIRKSKNLEHEHNTFSGKAGTNTKKTLAVIDRFGVFRFVSLLMDGRQNDREQYTASDLYVSAGRYFSFGEKLASDGGFRGDGNLVISYDNLDTVEKEIFNLAFKEVRVGVENAFGRVQMWFPILGAASQYWRHDEELLELAVGAACKLHNWMLRIRGLQYDALQSPRNHYREFY